MKAAESVLAQAYGDWLHSVAAELPSSLRAAVQRLLAAQQEGHVCIGLTNAEQDQLPSWQATGWLGQAGDYRPFIVDAGLLYLARYQAYEAGLAQALRERAQPEPLPVPAMLDQLFPQAGDRQRQAALLALRSRLLVISGGPGTGKTSTVVKLLALLLADGSRDWRIALAAPTGKAAQRLGESIRGALEKLALPAELAARIPATAQTLHRLLGAQGDTGHFRHDAANPLGLDLLIVDEASMIDLALMAKLLAALPPTARLILLGDKDQLASVEAGNVLGDICAQSGYSAATVAALAAHGESLPASPQSPALGDALAFLDKSHRFRADSGIGELARASREGEGAAFTAAFARFADIAWENAPRLPALLKAMEQGYAPYFAGIAGQDVCAPDVAAAFSALLRFRLLCAQRTGPWGVENLNRHIERQQLGEDRLGHGHWYAGRAVMVTANDYSLRLFNGDIGICLNTADGLRVFFEAGPGEYRALHPGRLPAHEPAWAMTVHKSQGSEFEAVLLVLPEAMSPVLNRPLVYTGITRAKERFTLWGHEAVLVESLARLPERASGLAQRLL